MVELVNFNIPAKNNAKLFKIVKLIEKDKKLLQTLKCVNVNAMERLHYSDHGPVHSKIVSNIALRILRILASRAVVPSIVRDYGNEGMDMDDAEIVVVLAAFLHDVGMIVQREQHDMYNVSVAEPILLNLLGQYPVEKRTIMISEIFHAMTLHESAAEPLTVEAGIVRIADALDMEEGRARIPFEKGKMDIHAVSALSIEKVEVYEGGRGEKPIQIRIMMSNSAGIFQIDELLKRRVNVSGLSEYVHVTAEITGREKGILGKIEY